MRLATVYQDKHGLYVRTGGYLFRPQPSAQSFGYPLLPPPKDGTYTGNLKKGDKVKARHIPQTPLGKVDGLRWFSHGCYINPKTQTYINSEELWDPETNDARTIEMAR